MPRIQVIAEDGSVFWDEAVTAHDFDSEHFRRALADRLGWAVADAEVGRPLAAGPAAEPHDRMVAA